MISQSGPNQDKNHSLPPNRAKSDLSFTEKALLWPILKAGILYFAIVFSVGFIFGIVRVLWAVPLFGTRVAELLETPFMFVATILTARWVVNLLAIPPRGWVRLGMGLAALSCLLIAEFEIVLRLRHVTIAEYLANRDPVAGAVYYVMLYLFAIMPWVISRGKPIHPTFNS
ncbi:MAG: hypothetical protein AAGF01_19460 [Cyanobacteria bacterium P01_G01_bin.38]